MSSENHYEDDREDRYQEQYAQYLSDQMEAQYWSELESQYELGAQIWDDTTQEEIIITSHDATNQTFSIERLPSDSEESFSSKMVRGQMERRRQQKVEENMESNHHHSFEPDPVHRILHLPLEENDAQAATVGEYLGLLLSTLWIQVEDFSSKRPFGNSNWQDPIYKALSKAGLVTIIYDEDGYIEEFTDEDEITADEFILQTIRFAYHG